MVGVHVFDKAVINSFPKIKLCRLEKFFVPRRRPARKLFISFKFIDDDLKENMLTTQTFSYSGSSCRLSYDHKRFDYLSQIAP